jgi:hypothetical protein
MTQQEKLVMRNLAEYPIDLDEVLDTLDWYIEQKKDVIGDPDAMILSALKDLVIAHWDEYERKISAKGDW